MNNTFYLMRHGHSQANEKGIITCDPDQCVSAYGLDDKGMAQAIQAAKKLKQLISGAPIVVSSDFLRAYQTAQILAAEFGTEVIQDIRLRERNFGQLHGQPDSNYQQVWQMTDYDIDAKPFGVESDREVLLRLENLISDLDTKYNGRDIILISHGDPLNIINAKYVLGDTTKQTHNFTNAEVRPLLSLTPSVTIYR